MSSIQMPRVHALPAPAIVVAQRKPDVRYTPHVNVLESFGWVVARNVIPTLMINFEVNDLKPPVNYLTAYRFISRDFLHNQQQAAVLIYLVDESVKKWKLCKCPILAQPILPGPEPRRGVLVAKSSTKKYLNVPTYAIFFAQSMMVHFRKENGTQLAWRHWQLYDANIGDEYQWLARWVPGNKSEWRGF